jgi:hypothetical protein
MSIRFETVYDSSQSVDAVGTMKRRLLAPGRLMGTALSCVACAILIGTPPVAAQTSSALTPREIDEAIDWGTRGDPTPYLLHHSAQPDRINPVIVGAIYTPFLRVALAAKAARSAGRSFDASEVAPSLVEPVFYVAFRWYCCVDSVHGADLATWDPSTPPTDYKIAVPGDRFLGSHTQPRVMASPLWIKRDLSMLTSFGGDLPYGDVVLIAGYSLNVLSTSSDFVIYRQWHTATSPTEHTRILVGRVTPDELARWR